MSDTLTKAANDVLQERYRQVLQEGWTPEHDDSHQGGILALAGSVYAQNAANILGSRTRLNFTDVWPFDDEWFKPTTPRRDLVKAAALILAEIERLDRMYERPIRITSKPMTAAQRLHRSGVRS